MSSIKAVRYLLFQEVEDYRYFDPKMLRVTDRCGFFLLVLHVLLFIPLNCYRIIQITNDGRIKHCAKSSGEYKTRKINRVIESWGVLNKDLYGEAPPQGPSPALLYTIFDRKRCPFCWLSPSSHFCLFVRDTSASREPLLYPCHWKMKIRTCSRLFHSHCLISYRAGAWHYRIFRTF